MQNKYDERHAKSVCLASQRVARNGPARDLLRAESVLVCVDKISLMSMVCYHMDDAVEFRVILKLNGRIID